MGFFSSGSRPKRSKKAILNKLVNKLKKKKEKARINAAIISARNQLSKF